MSSITDVFAGIGKALVGIGFIPTLLAMIPDSPLVGPVTWINEAANFFLELGGVSIQ